LGQYSTRRSGYKDQKVRSEHPLPPLPFLVA
jgi:hypothetical protein